MKQFFIVISLCLITAFSFAQNFEGRVLYQNNYKSNNVNISDQQLNEQFGTIQEYFIKNDLYKSVFNGTVMQWQLYMPSDNRLYNKFAGNATAYYNSAATNADKVLEIKVNRKAATILNIVCDELILKCKSGTEKYYYNSKYAIDPSLFAKHKFGNWFEYLQHAKALPLKTIYETPQFIMISTVTQIIPETLDSKVFELPANTPTAPMAM